MLIGFCYLNAAALKIFFTVSSRPGVFIWIKNVLCEVWCKGYKAIASKFWILGIIELIFWPKQQFVTNLKAKPVIWICHLLMVYSSGNYRVSMYVILSVLISKSKKKHCI